MAEPVQHNMKFKVMMINAAIAVEWLAKRHAKQRKKKPRRIAQYTADMLSGFWRLTHQGVAFDEDGYLVDGQNRLQAVIDANEIEPGIAVPMAVFTGVPRKAMVAADCNASRSAADAARVDGDPFGGGKNENAYASVVRNMLLGLDNDRLSPTHQEQLNFRKKHKEAIDFTF